MAQLNVNRFFEIIPCEMHWIVFVFVMINLDLLLLKFVTLDNDFILNWINFFFRLTATAFLYFPRFKFGIFVLCLSMLLKIKACNIWCDYHTKFGFGLHYIVYCIVENYKMYSVVKSYMFKVEKLVFYYRNRAWPMVFLLSPNSETVC